MGFVHALVQALTLAGSMTWEITWALILGFTLSAIVQAVVRREAVTALLGDDRPRTLAIASGLGAASSSCSYAAVALARSLFRRGASFTAAMAFEVASTNLVIELGILLILLIGWQFAIAEYLGGAIMVAVLAVLFRLSLSPGLIQAARTQADKGVAGSMEGHAAMDMSVTADGPLLKRVTSPAGVTAVSHIFVMDWAAVIRDVVVGLLIAGAIGAWVPDSFWQSFFLVDHPLLARVWGPLIGPVVAILSFVCSIGNVPLAGVLWNGGISFGGVVSFIFADLLILPILLIYRKYYGTRMTIILTATFYAASVIAGYVVEVVFAAARLIPAERNAQVQAAHISWNYTTLLNIAFLLLAAALILRFLRTGGMAMMAMMNGGPDDMAGHEHGSHDHSHHDHDHPDHSHHDHSQATRHEHGVDHGPEA